MRNVSLTLVHIIPTVRMWPEIPTPAEIARHFDEQGHGFLRDGRTVAEEAMSGSDVMEVDTKLLKGVVLPSLVDLSNMPVIGARSS
jgi:hypothetical protein